MRRVPVFFNLAVAFGLLSIPWMPTGAVHAAEPITLQSLLAQMIDRDVVARLPEPAFSLKQASSHDQRKNDPGDPATWHSNNDFGQFLHTETHDGRREWVIMEADGPGAVVRFWTPLLADKDKQVIRFYFDGSATPAITANFNALLSGRGLVKPPLAFTAWNEMDVTDQLKPESKPRRGVAGDLYLPIPFAKGCKITLDSLPLYYVINYRGYEPGTAVKTFSMSDFDAAKPELARIAQSLANTRSHLALSPHVNSFTEHKSIVAGETISIELPQRAASIRELYVAIDPKDAPQAMRDLVLEATFDDVPCIWCPLAEFFGAGVRISAVQDWWRTVQADGALASRWVMPYERSARVTLKNVGKKSLAVSLTANIGFWKWDERSLHFHANWRGQFEMPTRPISDWNYIDIQGQGRYVGDTLTVFSPVKDWYGEGDERIYYDGATFPAHIGTGTEDYYGYAWGMAGFFNSPFISMPKRDGLGQDWKGYTTTSRIRLLDNIPFRSSLKHDMENWNWADTKVDYAVGTFWYARPGAKHNRQPQPQEAAKEIRQPPDSYHLAGAVECESMAIVAKSDNLQTEIQTGGLHGGQWSGEQQLFVRATKPGDFVELQLPVGDDQPRRVTLHATKAPDYGILRFSLNGQKVGDDFDGYHGEAVASGPIVLGTVEPKDGKFLLRVEVIGANSAASGAKYFFGLDCVKLDKP